MMNEDNRIAEQELKLRFYEMTTQHYILNSQLRWTTLNNFLVVNSILTLAWVTVFTASSTHLQPQAKIFVLSALPAVGLALCIIWWFFTISTNNIIYWQQEIAGDLEKGLSLPSGTLGPLHRLASLENHFSFFHRLIRTSAVVHAIIGSFTILNLILLFTSIFLPGNT